MKILITLVTSLALGLPTLAQAADAAPPPAMDPTKMGPAARKPTNEKATKKEIQEWLKQEDEIAKKKDMEAMLARIDFPVYMATDDLKGMPKAMEFQKDQYTAMMKPWVDNMPADMKMTHKPTITVLSDSLAVVTDEFTMTTGKTKVAGKNGGLVVKKDGAWKWKSMVEAGWGDMAPPAAAAPAPAPAAPAPAPQAPAKK